MKIWVSAVIPTEALFEPETSSGFSSTKAAVPDSSVMNPAMPPESPVAAQETSGAAMKVGVANTTASSSFLNSSPAFP
jgi:hypothetical protein